MASEHDLIELQAKLAFAEDQIDALNATVYRQQQSIEQLARELVSLRRLVQESLPQEPGTALDGVPPHW